MKFKRYKKYSRQQDGASMVEFAIAFPFVLLTIVFLVDTGLYLFKRSLVTDAAAFMTRQLTVDFGQYQASGLRTCASLLTVGIQSRTAMETSRPKLMENMSFFMTTDNYTSVPYQLIQIRNQSPFYCILCNFIGNPTIEHISVLVIERDNSCTGGNISNSPI